MLISPPFLPERGTQNEDQWLDAAMPECAEGRFPVSHQLCWHGGRHLSAPLDDRGGPLPVRAVADGTVVFVRRRTESAALTYAGGYHSDGVVVIRHDTEIGANEQNEPTSFRFYSVYMHLNGIEASMAVGRPVYRKDAIATAGHIQGQPNLIHFEICCDDENLQRLVGRTTGELRTDRDGRTDALYGEVYFRLPTGTPVYADEPAAGASAPRDGARVLSRCDGEWLIGLRYETGNAIFTTYSANGSVLAELPRQANAEYELHRAARSLSEALRAAQRAGSSANLPAPSPSACHELLRAGRVMGPDTLPSDDVPHWRQIATPAGPGWVNLNAPAVRKFSDADFPHWRGWTLIDDSPDRDSRCDSQSIRQALDANGNGHITLAEATAQLRLPAVGQRFAKMICKFPSEWDRSAIDTRWSWLRQPTEEHPEGMNDEDFGEFRAHAQALCFELPELTGAQWHFEPKTFIRHLRRCGWRSAREMIQCVPRHAVRTAQNHGRTLTLWEAVNTDLTSATSVLSRYRIQLNKMMRTYGIDTPFRQATFFGNAVQETGWLGALAEGGGNATWYAPWYGRGFLQLTNPGNYFSYWLWRNREVPEALRAALVAAYNTTARLPYRQRNNALLRDTNFGALTAQMIEWRDHVQGRPNVREPEEQWAPCDSAGFYWVTTGMARYADQAHILDRHAVMTDDGEKVYYRSFAFWQASATVNMPSAVQNRNYTGLNGFDSRCCAYSVALAILTEALFPDAQGRRTLWYPQGYFRGRR